MSSGQSERNGSSVEPGLPKTFLMPTARRKSRVACLTVTVLLADLRDNELLRRSGMVRSTRPGTSRFRVRCFASPRNDINGLLAQSVRRQVFDSAFFQTKV